MERSAGPVYGAVVAGSPKRKSKKEVVFAENNVNRQSLDYIEDGEEKNLTSWQRGVSSSCSPSL